MPKASGICFKGERYWSPLGSTSPSGVLDDISRYHNNGVFTAGTTWSQLPSGLFAISLDGVTSQITLGTGASLYLNTQQTFKAWVKFNNFANNYVVFNKDLNTPFAADIAIGYGQTIDAVYLGIGANMVGILGGSALLSTRWNQWIHVWNIATSTIEFYLNGVVMTLVNIVDTLNPVGNTVMLGARGGATPRRLPGYMALPEIHNYLFNSDDAGKSYESERRWFNV